MENLRYQNRERRDAVSVPCYDEAMKPRNGKVVTVAVALVVVLLVAIVASPFVWLKWSLSHEDERGEDGPVTSAPAK